MSMFSPWDEHTRGKVRASMQSIYDLFLKRVSEGRDLPVDKVATFAEGRLFAGEEAKTLGMVDAVGGIEDAIKLAIELAKVPDDTPVDLVGTPPTFFEALGGDDASGESGESAPAIAAEAARHAAADAALAPWLAKVPEMGAFAGALGPLFTGERVLAITPFAFALR
jgi:protease-4